MSRFEAELDALRGPAIPLWQLAVGIPALFAAVFGLLLLWRRKAEENENKAGR